MKKQEILHAIGLAIKKDKKENPQWPVHIVAQTAMVSCECGKLTRSSIDLKYNPDENNEVVKSAQEDLITEDSIMVIVKAFRLLENLKP